MYLDDKFDKRPGKLNLTQKFNGIVDTNAINFSVEQPIRSKKYKFSKKENEVENECCSNSDKKEVTLLSDKRGNQKQNTFLLLLVYGIP